MPRRFIFLILLLAFSFSAPILYRGETSPLWGGQLAHAGSGASAIWNSLARVEVLKAEKGAYGFTVKAEGSKKVCNVELTSGQRWTASDVKTGQEGSVSWVIFKGIDTTGTKGTPVFGDDSFIKVSLKENNPFPEVEFSLNFASFDEGKWKTGLSPVSPLYYLRCTPPKSTMFYIGGGYIPSPQVEEFPLKLNKGRMSGEWGDKWSYAPAMAGWAVPAVGLWDHEGALFVGYDFAVARHTDKTEKYIASAYCAGTGDHSGQFFTLVHPYQTQWSKLVFPKCPSTAASHFEIVYSFDIPSWKDPNMFVMKHIYEAHKDLLPEVSRMNDVGFMPVIDSWTSPYGLGYTTGAGAGVMGKSSGGGLEGVFIEIGTTVLGNRFIADAMGWVRYQKNKTGMRGLKDQLKYLMKKAVWMNISGDTCCVWVDPLEGPGFKKQWGGKEVETIYNECVFDIGTAMVFAYMDKGETQYLPFVDGVYNWAKHFLFQRNGVCDLSWAMFCHVALSGGENFMLNYRKFFKNDPRRGKNYGEALDLAAMCLYKTMWIYTADPDETDLMDPSFLIQAVNSDWWIGKVTWNECGWIPRVMIPVYVETGDPLFKYLLRGVLDKFWTGYKADAVHVVENIEIFGEKSPKGERSGSPFDGCMLSASRRWAYPVGDAVMRVDVGEKAAIAFCKDTRDFDAEDYACDPEMNCSFKVVSLQPSKPSQPINIIVTAPFKDLRGKKVYVNGAELGEDRSEFNEVTEGEDVYIKGVKPGDAIKIGELKVESSPKGIHSEKLSQRDPFGKVENVKIREARKEKYTEKMGFKCLNLSQFCNSALELRWWRKDDMFKLREDSWFGYSAGEHIANGVPFMLEDPVLNSDKVFIQGNPGSPVSIPVGEECGAIVLFFGSLNSEGGPSGKASVEFEDGSKAVLDVASSTVPADFTNNLPVRNWDFHMLWFRPEKQQNVARIIIESGRLFAVTLGTEGRHFDIAARLASGIAEEQALRMQNYGYYLPSKRSPVDWAWWDKSWKYRALMEVDAGVYERKDAAVRLKEDFEMLFRQAGVKDNFDSNSLRIVEYSSDGKALKEVPAQFDVLKELNGSKGELIFIMPEKSPAGGKRYFYAYFDSKKSRKKPPKPSISVLSAEGDRVTVNTGKGGVEFEYLLDGNGVGPRITNITFDTEGSGDFANQNNALGRSGYNSGYADLTACQDPILWYNFGLLQSDPCQASVVHLGQASLTLKISGKELWGAGDEIGSGKSAAGRKGLADLYFRFYAGKPEFDSWIDYSLEKPDTKWTRDLQVRYGLNDWSEAASASKAGVTYATGGQVAVVPLDEEQGRSKISVSFTTDGNVLQLMLGKPEFKGSYFTDKWRTMPALGEDAYLANAIPVKVTQYAIEINEKSGANKPEIISVKPELYSTIKAVASAEQEKPLPSPEGVLNKDFSFEEKGRYWGCEPDESYFYYGDSHSGRTCVRLSIAKGGLALIRTNPLSSYLMDLSPNKNYKVSFWAKAVGSEATVMVNFYGGGAHDFKQIPFKVEASEEWKKYEMVVPTGNFPKGMKEGKIFASSSVIPGLRIWLLSEPAEVYIDDVEIRAPAQQ
ncbi:hypothetical protein AUJ67_04025 [Candidatus Desantisbacteria bacterium CG1_02_49_89]|nr:MAG: hypothetical protein AUJ67_04025 [Candidatus Desantisbacteria bacterium CG1_02_49_89]